MNFLKKLFGEQNFEPILKEINLLEPELEKLSNDELKNESLKLKEIISGSGISDKHLPRAFALIREAARRNLKQRHFDVQLIGGIILHQGKIAQMATGEGKTLAATSPAYFNALTGKGVHAVTVNDYLAKRDAVWMGQIYSALGLTVGCLTHDSAYIYDPNYIPDIREEEQMDEERDAVGSFKVVKEFLRPISRREAYKTDILYGTNHEFGFDYLRDNLAYRPEEQVQRGHYYAIIDEVDSILIDEARTPLIIAAPDIESSDYYKIFAKAVANLNPDEDYIVDEKARTVSIIDNGINKIENFLKIKDIYSPENFQLVHYLEESLKAKALFIRDKNYVVRSSPSGEGQVIIVDEFTGRMMPGRRYSGGLHQAIEAKEGVKIEQESRTFAQITIQNYFRLYEKISGMTGTAQTSAEEFHKVYNLEVATVPTNRPNIRKDYTDLIYKTLEAKYGALIEDVRKRHMEGQPILIGTTSIEKNEVVSKLLKQAGIPHEALNAKNHEREGEIIAQAGRLRAVTVATNMAGRGVDIILGGNPATPEDAQKVRELGGLHVIGTDRHEARRIDHQLQGRAGRQGDQGSTQFLLSLEDDLLRIFGGERVKKIMEAFNLPEDQPIESSMVSRIVVEAQKKVEGLNFDMRKHLLDYDDVLNKQRTSIYNKREDILKGNISEKIDEAISNSWNRIKGQFEAHKDLEKFVVEKEIATKEEFNENENFEEFLKEKVGKAMTEAVELSLRHRLLAIIDRLWLTHLENLEDLRDSVRIRAYGQHDPLVEYRRDSYQLFQNVMVNFEDWVFTDLWKILNEVQAHSASSGQSNIQAQSAQFKASESNNPYKDMNIGRNDLCPCGSGKKYKKCHGK